MIYIYIDYRDNGDKKNYKPLISILGLDKNFNGSLEFKLNRMIQNLSYRCISMRDIYVAESDTEGITYGVEVVQALEFLTLLYDNGGIKRIMCYRKTKDGNYIEIRDSEIFEDYFY